MPSHDQTTVIRRTCSWCHEINELRDGPTACIACGHRADVPRICCDCRLCAQPYRPPAGLPTEAELNDVLDLFARRGK